MARSPFQSDFVIQRDEPPPPVTLPEGADAVALPTATLRSPEASARATRWVLILTFVVLAALVVLCAVGPHIPGGG
ncbi:MAG: hypothetical protein IPQ07_14565 [Myxococcales bacterium]|nr:hypothetical protein [Myxococcales bacterium]